MKIKELIERLKAFDPEMLVVTRGMDEYGFADIEDIQQVQISGLESEASSDAFGEYREASESTPNKIQAILIDHL